MIKIIYQLFDALTKKQKNNLFIIQILLIFMSLIEVISIYSIAPFIGYVSGALNVNNSAFLGLFISFLNINESQITVYLGVSVVFLYCFSILISIIVQLQTIKFGNKLGAEISTSVFKNYLNKDILFFKNKNSSFLTNSVFNDTSRVTGIILKTMSANLHLSKSIIIITGLFIYDSITTLSIMIILAILYISIFTLLKKKIAKEGEKISTKESQLLKLIKEGFGSIKELIIYKKEYLFSDLFSKNIFILSKARSKVDLFSLLPRYFVELFGFLILIFLLLFNFTENFAHASIVLSVFGMGLLKLVPCFQNLYFNIAGIKSSIFSFNNVKNELRTKNRVNYNNINNLLSNQKLKSIILNKVNYKYPDSKVFSIMDANIEIKTGEVYGVLGRTGSGKTTFFNLLLGLLKPSSGDIFVDEFDLSKIENLNAWQSLLSYVPQNPFLLDSSIRENIVFDYNKIDDKKISEAIKVAQLEDFINELPFGLDTIIGENAVKISGGQAQRISIARAIYKDSPLLFLDEATNALDINAEKLVLDGLMKNKGRTIFAISHKIEIVKYCKKVIFCKKGNIIIKDIPKIEEDQFSVFNSLLNS